MIATDASPAMLDLARKAVEGAEDIRTLVLPDDPIPAVDAIVEIRHASNYLSNAAAVRQSLIALSDALLPGGSLAVELRDLEWGTARQGAMAQGRVGDDWAIVRFSQPAPDRFDRNLIAFVRGSDGSCRREDEHHGNVDVAKDPQFKGFSVIRRRWVVEQTIDWLMQHRRLARDYETLPATSAIMIRIAMIDADTKKAVDGHPTWRDSKSHSAQGT